MAEIELCKVTKSFGDVVAMNDVSFLVHDQEFLVMLGPSGAGKTTTLRTVAGLERPNSGQVLIDGDDLTRASPAEHGVAFVFQNYALYPFMTVEQNMAFALKADKRIQKSEIARRVQDVAQVLQIEGLLKRKPAQLSGGQQQRVALGRAMVRHARAFLMDEPLTNLDAKLRTLMRSELKHLQRDLGATTLYVTHDHVEAMTMGDRILVLKEGAIQQIGTPDQIYNQPANLFVAGFVGSPRMNLLSVHTAPDNSLAIAGYDTPIPLAGRVRQAFSLTERREMVLGVRPEDTALSERPEPGWIEATVYASEPLGDRTIVDVQLGEQMIKAKTSPAFSVGIGQPIWFKLDMERGHLFDGVTGDRVDPDGPAATVETGTSAAPEPLSAAREG